MPFSFTVLGGASGGIPLGSGVLLEGPGGRRLLDCGNGVVGGLHAAGALDVEDVLLTHLHADHVQDLYPLALYRRYVGKRLPVAGPAGTRALVERWFPLFSGSADEMLAALDIREPTSGEELRAAGLVARPFPVEHNTPGAFGYVVRESADGPALLVSGDTRACAALEDAARGADTLLCESTFAGEGREGSRAHHMTAAEAGALARRAGVRRLVLTHLLVTTTPDRARAEAEAAFGGPVEVARPGERRTVA